MTMVPDLFAPAPLSTAVISDDGLYRYHLGRTWGSDPDHRVVFVMLNPSTADAAVDDPTIRRCIGFAKAWGYDGLAVVNLFAFRATSPADMKAARNPIGLANYDAIIQTTTERDVVAAWGTHGSYRGQDRRVTDLIRFRVKSLSHLGLTKDGHPKHPLYIPADQVRIPFGVSP